ncbi:hypothetical protein N657DRAFT_477578 [Parathielavia appendiculata]|uniref:Uncharacterized protein n=1 Tax=Parathielavia appendiculata TaxID=2587402 RepID=A0AAN6TXT7_9PEZI|nr:hypothetical protein N657DRAFT_477578 [Parathielavia appendiculata]
MLLRGPSRAQGNDTNIGSPLVELVLSRIALGRPLSVTTNITDEQGSWRRVFKAARKHCPNLTILRLEGLRYNPYRATTSLDQMEHLTCPRQRGWLISSAPAGVGMRTPIWAMERGWRNVCRASECSLTVFCPFCSRWLGPALIHNT